jgi:hypothetical protein
LMVSPTEYRNRIEAAVEKRVPLPTKEEYDRIVRDCLAIFGDWRPPPRWAAIAEANITVAPRAFDVGLRGDLDSD